VLQYVKRGAAQLSLNLLAESFALFLKYPIRLITSAIFILLCYLFGEVTANEIIDKVKTFG
jgi:hypothetical protein